VARIWRLLTGAQGVALISNDDLPAFGRQAVLHACTVTISQESNIALMQVCTTQRMWNAQDIFDKVAMGLPCCKAVQKKVNIGTVRMQSQLLTSSMKGDTRLMLKHNLYKLDNKELMQKEEMSKTQELMVKVCNIKLY